MAHVGQKFGFRAIRSLGTIAVMGEVTCLLAAVTALPALWYLVERRRTAVDEDSARDAAS